jgi:regulator of CtrA degradation
MAAKIMNFPAKSNTVSFGQKLASSEMFKALFKEGMSLVEEAATYLDGPGRSESRVLQRTDALAYASESMRLTTRLMQLASWLLLQRAVNEGEMSLTQAATEKHKVKLTHQDLASRAEVFERLPETLRSLVHRSLRLQERILHLDRVIYAETPAQALAAPAALMSQMAMLQEAFRVRVG